MSFARVAAVVAAKDVLVQLRNGSVLVLGLLAPLGLAFVLNLVFGGLDDPDAPVTFDVGLVDLDGGELAGGFGGLVDEIAATGLLDLTRYDDEAAARAAVEAGDIGAAWVVPAGFEEIVVIADVDAPNVASAARAIAGSFASRAGTAALAAATAVETGVADAADAGAVADAVAGAAPLASVADLDVDAAALDVTTSLTAGLALFFVFFTAGLPLVSILAERGQGTLARMLAAPIRPSSVLAGKVAAGLVLGVLSLSVLMAASSLLLGARWGSPPGALLLATGAVLAVSGIVAVTGSLARTAEQAGGLQAIVAIVLGVLGGTFVPIPGSGQGVLGAIRSVTPNGIFMDGLTALRDDGLAAALPSIAGLAAIGAATGVVGLVRARRLLRP